MKKMSMLSVVFGALVLANSALAQKTVYFVGGADPTLPRNTAYIELLEGGLTFLNADLQEVTVPGLGYNVTFVAANGDENAAESTNFDVVILHESAGSGDFDEYANLAVPVLGIEQVIAAGRPADRAGSLYFTEQANVVCCAEGDFEIEILDGDHPITEPWNTGDFFAITQNDINAQVSGIAEGALAPAATPLALAGYTTGTLKIMLAVMEAGASGLAVNADQADLVPEGADPTPARRAFLGYHERVQVFDNASATNDEIAFTEDGAILFQRVVQWLVGDLGGGSGGSPVEEWALY